MGKIVGDQVFLHVVMCMCVCVSTPNKMGKEVWCKPITFLPHLLSSFPLGQSPTPSQREARGIQAPPSEQENSFAAHSDPEGASPVCK